MAQPWSFSRLEIRAPLTVAGGSFARVELVHPRRGRVTDIGRGRGPMDAIFRAVGRIVGVEADIQSLEIDYKAPAGNVSTRVFATLVLRAAGDERIGRGVSDDLLTSCVIAYLDAAAGMEMADAAPRTNLGPAA